jgi:plasmid stabilization system protein ParE
VTWSRNAISDLRQIHDYIARDSYRLIYLVQGQDIEVVAVLHGRQDPESVNIDVVVL